MLLIQRIEITNFVCFDHIEIEPSTSREKPLTLLYDNETAHRRLGQTL